VAGVVVLGLVDGGGAAVVGAGPRGSSARATGAGPGGEGAGDAGTGWLSAGTLGGGAGMAARAANEDAGACGAGSTGPGGVDVGVVLGRGFAPLSEPYMRNVTPANPIRNAATQAQPSSRRRVREERRSPPSPSRPSVAGADGLACSAGEDCSSGRNASRTVAGETGTLPAFRRPPRGKPDADVSGRRPARADASSSSSGP
jgi:hypothetical protein